MFHPSFRPPRVAARLGWLAAGVLSASSLAPRAVQAQATTPAQGTRARIAGRVIDAGSKLPIVGANVFVNGTPITATTGPDGRFAMASVPVGIYTVEAKKLGFGPKRFENVRLRADSVMTLDFVMSSTPLLLDQVTVAGTIDETSVAKSTLTVAKLGLEEMPIQQRSSAAAAVAGKVAGVTVTRPSGAPGSQVNILLRTPISGITEGGVAPSPLFVVDGVFLNQTQQFTLQDIEGMDVQSIEVIKGAAAASLYGSRAAAGVIAITTNRGRGLALGTTQFTLRNEYGFDQYQTELQKNQHHQFLQDAQGNWLNAAGQIVPRAQRAVAPLGIMDKPFTSPTYNQAQEFFKPGRYNTQTATVQGNSAATNYIMSYTRSVEPGVLDYNRGLGRNSFRLNVDSRVNEKLNVSVSANHSRVKNDAAAVSFNNFYRIDTDVNLKEIDPRARFGFPYKIVPDSVTLYVNPLYQQFIADNETRRSRTTLAVNTVYRPYSWLSLAADGSYDRGDLEQQIYTARGTPVVSTAAATLGTVNTSTGSLRIDNDITDQIFGVGTASVTKALGSLTMRVAERVEVQREVNPYISTTGTDFATEGLKAMSQARVKNSSQSFTDRRTMGSTTTLNLNLSDKYIGDFLVRREGNSLFGRANRWNTFGRASAAWVVSEEGWFPFEAMNLLKLRASWGVTGVSPGFSAQYEALTSDGTGGIRRGTLGNVNVTPTRAAETEFAVDMTLNSRVSLSVVHAINSNENVFVNIPAPAYSGFSVTTRNPAILEGNVTELTLQGQVLSNPTGLQWTSLVTASRQAQYGRKFGRTCFDDGLQYKCDGVATSEMWGNRLITSKDNLPAVHRNSGALFDINDEGWVVPVGAGNTWRDGVTKNLWGSTVLVDGITRAWGRPIPETDANGQLWYGKIGDSNPGLLYGVNNIFRLGQARLQFQLTGQFGGNTYANSNQTFYASGDHPVVDQTGRSDELKKPVAYYNAVANNNNLYLANFVESSTYLNLAEVILGYSFDAKRFGSLKNLGVSRLQVDLVGRNLMNWTNYTGLNVNAGSPTVRFDDATYPLTRTWSGVVTLTF